MEVHINRGCYRGTNPPVAVEKGTRRPEGQRRHRHKGYKFSAEDGLSLGDIFYCDREDYEVGCALFEQGKSYSGILGSTGKAALEVGLCPYEISG